MTTEELVVEVETPSVEIKLFGMWSSDEVHVNDISLAVSISLGDHAINRLNCKLLCIKAN